MKERPILFSALMVRAILEGRKSQTRRIVKKGLVITCDDRRGDACAKCPYGVAGDRLWVREAWWMHDDARAFGQGDGNVTDADGLRRLVGYDATMDAESQAIAKDYGCRKRPGLFMPRWASRLTLLIKAVRVERLQEISEADAIAEGIEGGGPAAKMVPLPTGKVAVVGKNQCRDVYMLLWESIHGLGSWDKDPWVWVVDFERTRQ